MAEWVHKERTWSTAMNFSWDKPEMLVCSFQDLEMDFEEWLDSQCNGIAEHEFGGGAIAGDGVDAGGWEVFKISLINVTTAMRADVISKWCIFRKKN